MMTERIVRPKGRGFLFLEAHPEGCARTVASMRAAVPPRGEDSAAARPVALIIGSSSGYGLAMTVAGLIRHGITGVGLCFERPPTSRRTGTAGWYRTIAAAKIAAEAGRDFAFVNADAFADSTKDEVLGLIAERFGGVDFLIYSVAAPRRTDTRTSQTYQSVIKPVGAALRTKTLSFDDGSPRLREVTIQPASAAEVAATVQVMGGEDWARWVEALQARDLPRPGFTTAALTYIGSHLTSAIYRKGTIGAGKVHLEDTAVTLAARLGRSGGRAFTSVNGAAVTQASTAIPGMGLYVSLLRSILGESMRSPAVQSAELWDHLLGVAAASVDTRGRIRLDHWELDRDVQLELARRWAECDQSTIDDLADTAWFQDEVMRLYGFCVPGIDYARPSDPELPWPAAGGVLGSSRLDSPAWAPLRPSRSSAWSSITGARLR
jgi:enoyl-[acyl-carrier protein] reductase / trans-2-enoyl-CoA reductase (NAD+)